LYPDGIDPIEAKYIVKHLLANYPISFAIVNSIDSRAMLQPLALSFVPTITLVHEFPDDLTRDGRPAGAMGRALDLDDANRFLFEMPRRCGALTIRISRDAAPISYLKAHPTYRRGNPREPASQASTLYNAIRPPGPSSTLSCWDVEPYSRKEWISSSHARPRCRIANQQNCAVYLDWTATTKVLQEQLFCQIGQTD
jgi:hypothetical protein